MIFSIIISTCFIHNVYSYSLLNTRGGGGDTLSRTQLIDLVDKTLGFDNNGQINPLPKKDKNTQYQNLLEYIRDVGSRLVEDNCIENLINEGGPFGNLDPNLKCTILENLTDRHGLLGGLDPVDKSIILRNLTNENGLFGDLGDDAKKMLRDAIGISDNDLLKFIANNKDQIKKTLEIK